MRSGVPGSGFWSLSDQAGPDETSPAFQAKNMPFLACATTSSSQPEGSATDAAWPRIMTSVWSFSWIATRLPSRSRTVICVGDTWTMRPLSSTSVWYSRLMRTLISACHQVPATFGKGGGDPPPSRAAAPAHAIRERRARNMTASLRIP